METIGIIGGLGPEATVDYYKEMIGLVAQKNGEESLNYPEIIVYSVNMETFIGRLRKKDYSGAAGYIAGCINKLAAAGATFAAISANTPHLLFNEIQKNVSIPLVSIVETCRIRAEQLGVKRCGLLGTEFTMNASFYADEFAQSNIEVVSPEKVDIERIDELLFTEMEHGIFKERSKSEILEIVGKMIEKQKIDAVILGCTEFPILFRDKQYLGIPFLNTTRIHVEAIIERSLDK